VANVLECVENLRSMVGRNAVLCIGDMFHYTAKSMESELDSIVNTYSSFDFETSVQLPKLVKKYGESKIFETDIDKVFTALVLHVNSQKVTF
jgi:hypothetical protein